MAANDDFDEFYRATQARMTRYAVGVTGDLMVAQDLVQEAYIRAWQRWKTVAAYDSAESWVRVVVTRLSNDRFRRLRVSRRIDRWLGPPPPAPPPSENTVLLISALRRLPVGQRRAVSMHYLADMSIADIAVEEGVAEGTVKSWLSRGRAAIAEYINAEEGHRVR
jgi:RNA polymerase sigma-70 factor (ECF subfamily)